jgi:site-specific DNA-cytosine methylase
MRMVDLFCGIGGIRLGFEGFDVVYSCEIELGVLYKFTKQLISFSLN